MNEENDKKQRLIECWYCGFKFRPHEAPHTLAPYWYAHECPSCQTYVDFEAATAQAIEQGQESQASDTARAQEPKPITETSPKSAEKGSK